MEKKKKSSAKSEDKSSTLTHRLTGKILLADMVIVALTAIVSTVLGLRLADGAMSRLQYFIFMVVLIVFICGLVIFFTPRVAGKIIRPIKGASQELDRLSGGYVDGGNVQMIHTGMQELDTLQNAITETVTYLNRYITNIDDTLDRISNSDLAFEITEDYVGDFVKIKDSMNKIVDSLNSTIKGIGSVSGEVLSISEQVSSSSQALAQGATEQASAVEELLSTVNGISSHVGETASNAGEANQKASEVREQITRSNEQMQTLIGAMDQISTTSNQVAKIVKIIEDIAFQTNILALNAAVEAARAGVNGKSFAVVADEVKNLATKSASAAEDTTKLIKDTISAVENGMTISTETADLLSKVVDSVDDVANIVSTISGAAQEENASISQVVQGLDQVSTVVQANSSSAEESAAVSHQLADSAKKLQDMVGTFRLRG
jgi:methyl-accepting chemotaxis protein